jgi:type III secretion protein S
MPQASISSVLYKILFDTAILVGPPLIISSLIGLVIGILQAVTQTQEQTLPQTVKMIVITGMLLSMGGVLSAPLYSSTVDIFSTFYRYQR